MEANDSAPSPRKRVKLDQDTSHLQPPSAQSDNMEVRPISLNMFAESDREIAFGITEFVSPSSVGFSGIVKKRYTDFQVFEITPEGEVVHLTDLSHPKWKDESDVRNEERPPSPARSSQIKDEIDDQAVPDQATDQNVGRGSDEVNGVALNGTIANPTEDAVTTEQPLLSEHPARPEPTQEVSTQPSTSNDRTGTELPEQQVVKYPLGLDGAVDTISTTEIQDGQAQLPQQLTAPALNLPEDESPGSEPQLKEGSDRKRYSVRLQRVEGGGWREMTEDEQREAEAQDQAEAEARRVQGEDKTRITPTFHYGKGGIFPQLTGDTVAAWNEFAGIKQAETIQLNQEDNDCLLKHFDEPVIEDLKALYNHIMRCPDRQTKFYGNVKAGKIDRGSRGRIHQDIRRIFNGKLDSETNHDGDFVISAMSKNKNSNFKTSNPRRTKSNKPRDHRSQNIHNQRSKQNMRKPNFLHFTLYKENRDTMATISFLSKRLHNRYWHVSSAGTKDRRGVTTQRLSVPGAAADKFIGVSYSPWGTALGNFEYRDEELKLGELLGNEFHITIRDCQFSYPHNIDNQTISRSANAIINESVRSFQHHGFLNYWGLQRFGTFGVSTDRVGIAMLQCDYARAVNLILEYKPECLEAENENMAASKLISKQDRARAEGIELFRTTGTARTALERLPSSFVAERTIINHLSQSGPRKDYLGALRRLPKNMRSFYVHAYQSLVWNHVASERWRAFGDRPVEGDLVILDKEYQKEVPDEVDADGEVIVFPAAQDRAAEPEDMFERARPLSREEAESGRFTIFDIVLPTPGYDIIYPANKIGEYYKIFMASEQGGGLDPHQMRREWRDISLSGSYRKLAAKPIGDVSFEIKTYQDEDEQFVETDIERYYKIHCEEKPPAWTHLQQRPESDVTVEGEEMASSSSPKDSANGTYLPHDLADQTNGIKANIETNDRDRQAASGEMTAGNDSTKSTVSDSSSGGVQLDWNGKPKEQLKTAIIIKMQLASSTYATMALRELMKKGGMKEWRGGFSGGR